MSTSRSPILIAGLAVLLAVPSAAAPQEAGPDTVAVTGVVGDARTGRPIPAALVEIPELGRQAITSDAGRFVFLDLPAGVCRLRISAMGYATWDQETELGHLDFFRIGLLPQPVALENIRVVAGRLQRRRTLATVSVHAVERRDLVRATQGTVADLVRQRLPAPRPCPAMAGRARGAGIVTAYGLVAEGHDPLALCIWSRGRPVRPNVFIDEEPVPSSFLWSYAPSEVYAVELYGGGQEIRVYTVAFIESGRPILPRIPGWR